MAITITRTAWIDDDGTGTTGTVINNAVKTELYDQIDGALAKAAQLAGGNAFTGNQSMTGTLFVNIASDPFAGQVAIASDLTAHQGVTIKNLSAGNTGNFVLFSNSAATNCGAISQASATTIVYGTGSDARLKTDDSPATDLAALRAVSVRDFTWKADGLRGRGVFAQDAYAVFPRAIIQGTDERTARGDLAQPWMTDYSKFVPDLIVGWQQHDAAIAVLRAALGPIAA